MFKKGQKVLDTQEYAGDSFLAKHKWGIVQECRGGLVSCLWYQEPSCKTKPLENKPLEVNIKNVRLLETVGIDEEYESMLV